MATSHSAPFRLALAFVLALAAPVAAWPPWISVEYPASLYRFDGRAALLVVHAHHRPGTVLVVRATAEGLAGGERRSAALTVRATDRPDTYAVEGTLARGVAWVITCAVQEPGAGSRAEALVSIAPDGRLVEVQVPLTSGGEPLPRAATEAEKEALLQSAAARSAGTAAAATSPSADRRP